MKIAVTTRENQIDEHFGHCEAFTIFTVDENNKITASELIASPAGCGCRSNIIPELQEKGVNIILTGNIGQGAVNMLLDSGIEVCRGCCGNVRDAAEAFLNGSLIDAKGVCQGHGNEGGCGGHHHGQ
ncbi:MAG TPA: dinitrogenase iron-molybdenum cofactor biosynthesis protein [Lentisphaeria bacterium]|nr:MAG: dinitrogenase iron-molybdenum cofactor biosynthesis protein [Lentisphaerae bacterium GWF2_38_69]HBM15753.1 dinitrogenase iron-molybdenum cofactor biosynthesis protein [Lentisphaeria bacterium]